MDIVLRAAAVYLIVLFFVRLRGKKDLNQLEVFDLVLLLIVSEATQQAMLGDDYSVTNGVLVVGMLFAIDLVMDRIKRHVPRVGRMVAGLPTLLMSDGELLHDQMRAEGVSEEDILQSARNSQGIDRLEKIQHVVLERNGSLSIIPRG